MSLPPRCSRTILATLLALPLSASYLELTGGLKDGSLSFFPGYLHPGTTAPTAPGPYEIRFLDASLAVLASVPFDLHKGFACGKGPCRVFEYVSLRVNLAEEVAAKLAVVQVLRDGKVLGAVLPSTAAPVREPRAETLGQGKVRVTWDHVAYPELRIFREDGAFIGSAGTGSLDVEAEGDCLDLDLSDGLKSTTRRIPVH